MVNKDIRKQVTDNPLLDQIIYELQCMIYEGIVFKNEEEANNYENIDTIKLSDRYSDIVEGKSRFDLFEYDMELLNQVPYLTQKQKLQMAKNNKLIPESAKELLHKLAKERFLNEYEETNNYYRRLNGLPDIGVEGIHLTKEQCYMIEVDNFDFGKYIHEMSSEEINILNIFGILDQIKEQYPDQIYLNFLGDKKINPYIARKLPNFSVLYLPSSESTEVHNKFLECLERNRVFFMKTIYSNAYKYGSKYYDNFIIIMIIIQSFADMITLSPEYIIRREVFDLRTIQYIFESQGCEFYPEIPLKYQKRLVSNLNRLIKYKSCDKNLVDIVSLFGFNDIQLFKYYILRIPIMNEDGTYRHDTIEDPRTGKDIPDYDNNYELKFLRVPIDEIADENIRNFMNYKDYDSITLQDKYWDGPYTHEYIKHQILQKEFNMCITKYISVDSVYSLSQLSFQLVYFINMIMYNGTIDNSKVTLQIPEISSTANFPFIDTLICLYSLMYLYDGFEDDIVYNPIQYLAINGFNFEVDMGILSTYVQEQGFTLEELGVSDFQIPKNGILTWNQLIEIYLKNKNIYNHIIRQINNANNKKIYDIYYNIYQSLMVTQLNYDYYRKINGKVPQRYSDYLEMKGSELYNIIKDCRSTSKDSDRKAKITKYINDIVENIYIYLDREEFQYIFQNIPTVSLDFIRSYMFKILNFFKSYKVDILNTNTIYKFDDKLGNKIKMIDDLFFKYLFSKTDNINIDDFINTLNIYLNPEDRIKPHDKLYMDITRWIRKIFKDKVFVYEDIYKLFIEILYKDYANLQWDGIYEYNHLYDKKVVVQIDDHIMNNNVYLTLYDYIIPDDIMYTGKDNFGPSNPVIDNLKSQLIDFEYIKDENDIYHITGWKGTYEGNPSTKCILPDSDRIMI